MVTGKEPIEITSKDLIKRPAPGVISPGGVAPQGGGGLNNIVAKARQVSVAIKQVQGVIEELRQVSGGKLDDIFPILKTLAPGNRPPGVEIRAPGADARGPQPNQGEQALMLLRMIQLRYGDMTLNELFDRLKTEYGNKRLSQLIGGKK